MEGYYCPDTGILGISSVESFECSPGTICGTGLSSDAGTACSVNKYCLSAAQIEYPCPDGYKNDVTG